MILGSLATALTLLVAGTLQLPPSPSSAQETTQERKFFPVQIVKDEIYSYKDLRFAGDFTSFESPAGMLALGRTEVGVTVMVVLGVGTLSVGSPEEVQEKFKTVFGNYPLKTKFNTLYMRLHPKEFDDFFSKAALNKVSDDAALSKAKEIFDQKFLGSYHAGPLAIIPPIKTRFIDFDTPDFGQVVNEEGYWLVLRRFSPYGSVYPARFVNPKQK